MADFLHSGWGVFITVVVVVSIAACLLLAWSLAGFRAPTKPDGTVESTGHVWDDDLQELNNPLPRWWLYLFYLTCVFGVLYLFLYPGLGRYDGSLKWSAASQYRQEMQLARETYDPLFEQYLTQSIVAVSEQPEATAMGERLFLTYCAQCHGSDARGSRSFPNLTDNDWLGEGSPEYIKQTILNGRQAIMPSMTAAVGGTALDIAAVAHYVMSLSGSDHDPAFALTGQPKFVICAACHGAAGEGNRALGAPNLTDDIWLYGGSMRSVQDAIRHGFANEMPAFGELLGDGKAHVLAAYVWSLSQADDAQSALPSDAPESE